VVAVVLCNLVASSSQRFVACAARLYLAACVTSITGVQVAVGASFLAFGRRPLIMQARTLIACLSTVDCAAAIEYTVSLIAAVLAHTQIVNIAVITFVEVEVISVSTGCVAEVAPAPVASIAPHADLVVAGIITPDASVRLQVHLQKFCRSLSVSLIF
jgi:hypothetical protein